MLARPVIVAQQRLDCFVGHIIRWFFTRLVGDGRVGSRRQENPNDFPCRPTPPCCSRSAGLGHCTMERRRTISATGLIDVGAVLNEGLDRRRASEAHGMMRS